MTGTAGAPARLLEACEIWTRTLEGASSDAERRAYVRDALPRLSADRPLFLEILRGIAEGAPYPDVHRPTLFPNEIVLHTHERRLFSLRMLLAEPGCSTPIHDHGAWGVITPLTGALEVVHYALEGPASEETFPGLRTVAQRILHPGETDEVHPLHEGIHRTGNAGQDTLIMLSVYGQPVRRPYVLGYDPERQRVYRIYTPRTRKRMLARDVLGKAR
jgi:hypothetical protein